LNKVINQPEYHDFYGEKKDPSKVMCIYDVVWAREKVAVESLSPMQWSRAFKSREICKNFFGDDTVMVRIIVFKPVLLEEETIFLEKPYIW
jgi:hypothetical protein